MYHGEAGGRGGNAAFLAFVCAVLAALFFREFSAEESLLAFCFFVKFSVFLQRPVARFLV